MDRKNRRDFLEDVGRGMLVASLGSSIAFELGAAPCWSQEPEKRLTFGSLEPLVGLMQETPPDQLLPQLVKKLNGGTELSALVSAAALANVRAFGGHDYTGYHTFMALVPAYRMAEELPKSRRALPVLKVVYRNSSRIHEQGAAHKDALAQMDAPAVSTAGAGALRDAVRSIDRGAAESRLAATVDRSPEEAFDELQLEIQDEVNVHRVVLASRAWAMMELTGQEHALSLLRQSVQFCLDSEQMMHDKGYPTSAVREVLPRLLDQHRLLGKPIGDRVAEDAWVEHLALAIFTGTPEQAADAAAAALAEGFHPDSVGEAVSMAANLLVLHDPGRRPENSAPNKPPGCVHGDSIGVHASDSANAWRNMAKASNPRNQVAGLIVGAYHTAGQFGYVGKDPYPYAKQLEAIRETDPAALLALAEAAIRENDQAAACAIVDRYGSLNLPSRAVFDLLLKYAISEDGALHAEKYYRTVAEEFARTRPAFRWRQLVSLARVTASEHGYPAPGLEQARELLGAS